MKIHLTSDVHLEFTDEFPQPPVADVGIFAGDIGIVCEPKRLIAFFNDMKTRYEHVIWVLGNHEFYHLDYQKAIILAKQIAQITEVHLLDIETDPNLELDGVKFWGSTLWSDANNDDWFAKRKISKGINDYRGQIMVGERKLSVNETIAINTNTREAINWDADVIITHFCPVVLNHPRIPLTDLSYHFYNKGLDDLIADSNVKVWCYGHTHHSTDSDINGTRLIANCHGFESRWSVSESSNYNPDLIIEI